MGNDWEKGSIILHPYLEKRVLASFRAVHGAIALTEDLFTRLPAIEEGLWRGQHVEGHGQRTAFVHVVEPQLGAGELPLHVAVCL